MEKELFMKNNRKKPVVIQHDDLKFDGENITIPRYWVDSLCEYINDYDTEEESEADIEDYKAFRSFLQDVQEYKNKGN